MPNVQLYLIFIRHCKFIVLILYSCIFLYILTLISICRVQQQMQN